jgi:hypothetical protein
VWSFSLGGIVMKITESITANLSMADIEKMINDNAKQEGYEVVRVTPEYKKQYSNDPRDNGMVTGQTLTGFRVDLKRKHEPTKREFGHSNIYHDR